MMCETKQTFTRCKTNWWIIFDARPNTPTDLLFTSRQLTFALRITHVYMTVNHIRYNFKKYLIQVRYRSPVLVLGVASVNFPVIFPCTFLREENLMRKMTPINTNCSLFELRNIVGDGQATPIITPTWSTTCSFTLDDGRRTPILTHLFTIGAWVSDNYSD